MYAYTNKFVMPIQLPVTKCLCKRVLCVTTFFYEAFKIISSSHYFAMFASTDRSSKVWKQLCDCPFIMMATTSSGNQPLAMGGVEVTKAANQPAEWIWLYDPDQDSWTPVQSMPSARKLCCTVVLVDNTLIVIGGEPDFHTVDIAEIV